jgi:hypothetical protein
MVVVVVLAQFLQYQAHKFNTQAVEAVVLQLVVLVALALVAVALVALQMHFLVLQIQVAVVVDVLLELLAQEALAS